MGENADWCYLPGEYSGITRMVTFASEIPNTPVDTFILEIQVTSDSSEALEILGFGDLLNGLPRGDGDEESIWGYDTCDVVPGFNYRMMCCGYDGLELSNNDTSLTDGTTFRFEMSDFDVDGDCYPDWGLVVGSFVDGVGVADVYWRPYKPPFGLDTIRHDTLYLKPMPEEWL